MAHPMGTSCECDRVGSAGGWRRQACGRSGRPLREPSGIRRRSLRAHAPVPELPSSLRGSQAGPDDRGCGRHLCRAAGSRPDGAKSSGASVTFRPAAGGATVADLDIRGASNITFAGSGIGTGFIFAWWNARIGTRNVSFRRVNSGGFDITSASNISIIGGQVGPQHSGYDPQINSGDDPVSPANILIDGVLFHDIQRATSADHTECLHRCRHKHCDQEQRLYSVLRP